MSLWSFCLFVFLGVVFLGLFLCFGFGVGLFVLLGFGLLFLWLWLFFGLCCFQGVVVVVLFFGVLWLTL